MVGANGTRDAPELVVTKPDRLRGSVYTVMGDYAVLGREEGCELRVDDVAVSRVHAALRRSGGQTVVSDLGSSNGTTVNGERIGSTGRPLRPGDVIRVGGVELRFRTGGSEATQTVDAVRPDGRNQVEYRIQGQTAGQLNNVGHDQYNSYVQHVLQERDSFARDIAATKTKASRLIWAGLAMFMLGFGTWIWVIFSFGESVENLPDDPDFFGPDAGNFSDGPELFGPDVGGVPIGAIGFALAALGQILVVVGIVLHIVAAARRRRLQEQPPPPPWQFAPPPPGQRP